MKKKVVLVRHGETALNKKGAYIGCKTDARLSAKGRVKCEEKAKLIREIVDEPKIIYSSPLIRCKETANIIWPGYHLNIIEDFKEIDFGDFEGKNYDDLKDNEYYVNWIESGGVIPFPSGEDMQTFADRNVSAFMKLVKDKDEMVIVAHGGTIMSLMSFITKEEYYSFMVKNLEGYIVEFELNGENISDLSYRSLNCGVCD